jgi:hypothetical protein
LRVDVDLFHSLHVDIVLVACLIEMADIELHVYKVQMSLLVERVLPEQPRQILYRPIDVTGLPQPRR